MAHPHRFADDFIGLKSPRTLALGIAGQAIPEAPELFLQTPADIQELHP